MMNRRELYILVVLLPALMILGCSHHANVFVVSLHEYAFRGYYDGSRLNREVNRGGMDKSEQVSRLPFIGSENFVSGEYYESLECPGRFGVRLYLDEYGCNRMMQASAGRIEDKFAIVVDGFYVGEAQFNQFDASRSMIELPPLWGEHEAFGIASHVNTNYTSSGINTYQR